MNKICKYPIRYPGFCTGKSNELFLFSKKPLGVQERNAELFECAFEPNFGHKQRKGDTRDSPTTKI